MKTELALMSDSLVDAADADGDQELMDALI